LAIPLEKEDLEQFGSFFFEEGWRRSKVLKHTLVIFQTGILLTVNLAGAAINPVCVSQVCVDQWRVGC